MEKCEFDVNQQVQFTLDADKNHWYVVLTATQVPNENTCVYDIELTTDSSMKFDGVPQSYMTDTDEGKNTPEASASS